MIHQRHRRTDDMRSQERALHYSASRGKKRWSSAVRFITNKQRDILITVHTGRMYRLWCLFDRLKKQMIKWMRHTITYWGTSTRWTLAMTSLATSRCSTRSSTHPGVLPGPQPQQHPGVLSDRQQTSDEFLISTRRPHDQLCQPSAVKPLQRDVGIICAYIHTTTAVCTTFRIKVVDSLLELLKNNWGRAPYAVE